MTPVDTYTHNIAKVQGQWPDEDGIKHQLDAAFDYIQALPNAFNVQLFQFWHTFHAVRGGQLEIPPTFDFPAAMAHAVKRCQEMLITPCAYIHPYSWDKMAVGRDATGPAIMAFIRRLHDMGITGVYFDGWPPFWDPTSHGLTDDMVWRTSDFVAELTERFPTIKLWVHDSMSTRVEWYHRRATVWLSGEGRSESRGATPWRHIEGSLTNSELAMHQMRLMASSGATPVFKLNANNSLAGGKKGDRRRRHWEATQFSVSWGGGASLKSRYHWTAEELRSLAFLAAMHRGVTP